MEFQGKFYSEPHHLRGSVEVVNIRDGLLFSNQNALGLTANNRFDLIAKSKYGNFRKWRIIAVRNVGNWLANRGDCLGRNIRY